jgi:hypothetical protein
MYDIDIRVTLGILAFGIAHFMDEYVFASKPKTKKKKKVV